MGLSKAKTALNVAQRQEPGACDTVNEVESGVNDGSIASVMFICTDNQHIIHRSLSCPTDHKDQKIRARSVGRRNLNTSCTLVTMM
jgi:hypothetical protein